MNFFKKTYLRLRKISNKIRFILFFTLIGVLSVGFFIFRSSPQKTRSCGLYSSIPPSFGGNFINEGKFIEIREEKPMVVIIPSYKNSAFCIRNLLSVFEQNYRNYRIIYIDDVSPDNTYEKVKEFVEQQKQGFRFTLIRNKERSGAMLNLYRAIHSCQDNEIIVTLDGDDFLAHENVLEKLNKAYANPDIWLTYGQYEDYPEYSIGGNRPIDRNRAEKIGFRNCPWVTSHLRTFYAWLFKKVKLQDFLYQGKFFQMTWDAAMMYPMIEMAWDHTLFIPDIMYLYNKLNPINDDKVNLALQQYSEKYIRSMPPYSPLQESGISFIKDETLLKADICLFSYNRPMQVYACLESMLKYIEDVNQVYVIYRADDARFEEGYEIVKKMFPKVLFFKQSSSNAFQDFKPLVLKIVFEKSKTPFIAFCVDDILVKDFFSFKECCLALEATQGYGFFLRLGEHVNHCYSLNLEQGIPPFNDLLNETLAWQFCCGKADWDYPNSLDMTIYKKQEIKKDLISLDYRHPNDLEGIWASHADHQKVGLCFRQSKIVNLPVNMVNISANRYADTFTVQELLNFFLAGSKIDISKIDRIKNSSAHIEHVLEFVPREPNENH